MIGYVPAETGWWADTVAAHFPSGTDLTGQLKAIGLPAEAMSWDVTRLSTGERHRLGLLRTIIQKPEVLLLDEPTASLDGEATAQIEALIKQKLSDGAAIILVTHDPAQAARLAARTFIMASGELTEASAAAAAP